MGTSEHIIIAGKRTEIRMVCTANFNKRCLLGINFAYIIAATILIGVASYAKHANIANTVPIVGGIIACGVFLLFVAVLGLIATFRQSQPLMFYHHPPIFHIHCVPWSKTRERIRFCIKRMGFN